LKIALLNIPIRAPWLGSDAWITVPPQGYGGIQWVVATLIDGLLELDHEVFLLGAPGSSSTSSSLKVIQRGASDDIQNWLQQNEVDIVHDSSNGVVPLDELFPSSVYISTHHLTGAPKNPMNTVYLSNAQRRQAGAQPDAPVIRLPVNPARYIFKREKRDYLLFLGRVSRWKGALEAAAFAKAAGLPLMLAGPSWEDDYLQEILSSYGDVVRFIGEVSGDDRLNLLADAKALMVMSQPVAGPWGDEWCEPGATVVSEAAASGTPVIATDNGCLAEIAVKVGYVLRCGEIVTPRRAEDILNSLPSPDQVRAVAIHEWSHVKVARQYENLYTEIIGGRRWC
jgi:glycosyltransferase involved in cell wall biosynthesis